MLHVKRRTVIALTTFALATAYASSQEPERARRVAAGALLSIPCDAEILPINDSTAFSLLVDLHLAELAVGEVLGMDLSVRLVRTTHSQRVLELTTVAAEGAEARAIELDWALFAGEGFSANRLLRIEARLVAGDVARDTLAQISTTLVERLTKVIEKAHAVRRNQLERDLRIAEERLGTARGRLQEAHATQQKLIEAAGGRFDLSREAILGQLRELREQEMHLNMDLAAQEARRQAIERHLAELAAAQRDSEAHDPVLPQLQEIIELRERQIARMKELAEKGLASEPELLQAREMLAQARVQLLERQRQAAELRTAAEIAPLRQELAQVSIAVEELRRRLEFVRQQLEEMDPHRLLQLAGEYEWNQKTQLPPIEDAVGRAVGRIEELREQLSTLKTPQVEVINSW